MVSAFEAADSGIRSSPSRAVESRGARDAPPTTPASTVPVGEPARQPDRRLHEIDGLRAVAIALVVIHHSLTPGVVRAFDRLGLEYLGRLSSYLTQSGVTLFFVLSGIVLMRPYLRSLRRFDSKRYFVRRAQRLWPTYLVALAATGLVIYLLGIRETWLSEELPRFSWVDFGLHAGIVNFGWPLYNAAWWSLGVEVIFYLLVPLALAVIPRIRGSVTTAAIIAAASVGISIVALARIDSDSAMVTLMAFLVYVPAFLVGILIAGRSISRRAALMLAAGGTTVVLASGAMERLNVHLGFAMLYAGIVILATEHSGQLRSWLSRPLMVWIGERSYSLFLIHVTAFNLVNYLASLYFADETAGYFIVSRAVGIPLAVLAAMALFSTVERRTARGLVTADRFWPRRLPPVWPA